MNTNPKKMDPALLKFFIAYFLAIFVDCMWSFAFGIYLVTLNNGSLRMIGICGFFTKLSLIILAKWINRQIIMYERLKMAMTTLFVQNASIAFSFLTLSFMLLFKPGFNSIWNGDFSYIFQSLLILTNIASSLSMLAFKQSIKKDWSLIIGRQMTKNDLHRQSSQMDNSATGDSRHNQLAMAESLFNGNLAKISYILQQIETMTSGLAPLLTGAILTFFNFWTQWFSGLVISGFLFTACCVGVYLTECFLLTSVQNIIIELKNSNSDLDDEFRQLQTDRTFGSRLRLIGGYYYKTILSWKIYTRQGIYLFPGVAGALFHMSIFYNDGIINGYGKTQQLNESLLGLMALGGVLMETVGIEIFKRLHQRLSLSFIFQIGSIYTIAFVLVGQVAIWLPDSPFYAISPTIEQSECFNRTVKKLSSFERMFLKSACFDYTSIILLLVVVSMIRMGLQLSFKSIDQANQERVNNQNRHAVSRVQNGLSNAFELCKHFMVIIFSSPAVFGILVMWSGLGVLVALSLLIAFSIVYTGPPGLSAESEEPEMSKIDVRLTEEEIQSLRSVTSDASITSAQLEATAARSVN